MGTAVIVLAQSEMGTLSGTVLVILPLMTTSTTSWGILRISAADKVSVTATVSTSSIPHKWTSTRFSKSLRVCVWCASTEI